MFPRRMRASAEKSRPRVRKEPELTKLYRISSMRGSALGNAIRAEPGQWPIKGRFLPPDHVSDPKMDFTPHKALMVDMADYWGRCE